MPDIEFDVKVYKTHFTTGNDVCIADAPIGINLHPDSTPDKISIADGRIRVDITNIKYNGE